MRPRDEPATDTIERATDYIYGVPTTHLQQILGACTQQTRTGAPATDTSGVCIRQTSAPATDTYASGVYNYRQSAPTTNIGEPATYASGVCSR